MDWDKAFEEVAAETGKRNDKVNPEVIAAKRAEEFERGVRLGWHEKDGNVIATETDEDDEGVEE